uniref:Uncharacterized protein n=1 Tax=Opuntia streptacantha TaxID=393608 RepID=A0A7C8ZCG1_OPUST
MVFLGMHSNENILDFCYEVQQKLTTNVSRSFWQMSSDIRPPILLIRTRKIPAPAQHSNDLSPPPPSHVTPFSAERNIWAVGRNDITIPLQQKFLKNTLGTADSEESFQRTLQKLGH